MLVDIQQPSIVSAQASGSEQGYSTFALRFRQELHALGVVDTPGAPLVLYLGPPHLMPDFPGQYVIASSMWEVAPIPYAIVKSLARADVLVVPSAYCKRIFRQAGLRQPIHVVPLGLDPDDWPTAPRIRRPGDRLRFLWVNAADERKGWMFLGHAWGQAFGPKAPVHLTIKTSANRGGTSYQPITSPQVDLISTRYSWEALRDLYCSSHVFICTSVCEGFGLSPLEAMAAGLLVISPRHTGLAEYIHQGVSWVCETDAVTMRYEQVPDLKAKAWAPKVSHLKALMRRAVSDFEATEPMRVKAQAWAQSFTWEASARKLLTVLQRVQGRQVA